MDIRQLNEDHGVEDAVRFEPGQGALPRAVLSGQGAEAHIYLHGAHVTHYQPAGGEPVLWLSDRSWFEHGKPIRGGIPICWPWFGPHADSPDAPAHGVARILSWQVESTRRDGERAEMTLVLNDDEFTRWHWPIEFELRYTVSVGASLRLRLETQNLSAGPAAMTEALHSYFRVSDVKDVSLVGLEEADYIDKVDAARRKNQGDHPIRFLGETDRVYVDTRAPCLLHDPGLGRTVHVHKDGSDSTVVWNPWINKAARMPDYGDEEWPGMVCIETANAADNAVSLDPGQRHAITAEIWAGSLQI